MVLDTLPRLSTMSMSDETPVRISKIAGRYLVFDQKAVARLRRHQNINGMLVGTTPQQPTQNIFLGLPIELRGEEASALVSAGAAFVVDDAAAHKETLTNGTAGATNAYVEALRRSKVAAQKAIAEQKAQKAADAANRHKKDRSKAKARRPSVTASQDGDASLFNGDTTQKQQSRTQQIDRTPQLAVTPTASDDLVSASTYARHTLPRHQVPNGPLCRLLQRTGNFMTPGLRFGSQYSVYPGDPLRFHAHFMANQYDWDEPIPTLEIVEGGRLATAVKKAFVIGGQAEDAEGEADVRTFSIEWAAM